MTPEEIQALIDSKFSALESKLDGALSALADKKPETPTEPSKDPLASRLAKLEKQLKEAQEREQVKEKEAQELRFTSALSNALGLQGSLLHSNLVQEVLANRLKNGAVEKDGEWYTKDGSKLTESVSEFLKSDVGTHFIASTHQNGLGTPSTKIPPVTPKPSEATLDDMVSDMVF